MAVFGLAVPVTADGLRHSAPKNSGCVAGPMWSCHEDPSPEGYVEITMMPPPQFPSRIICLTEETTETLYLLGEQDRIAGISGYTVRPPEARQKPKVSAFIRARFDKILSLKPDLVLAFSDLQADIAAELIRSGINVFTFNQRDIKGILSMIIVLGAIVGKHEEALALANQLTTNLEQIRSSAARFSHRPRVLFEEWDDPLISGICWVEELIEIAGGDCVFPELRRHQAAKDRVINPASVPKAMPEVILASWCGKRLNKEYVRHRQGWEVIPAVTANHIYEIKSAYILQPGPAALTEGVRQIHALLARVVGIDLPDHLAPREPLDSQ